MPTQEDPVPLSPTTPRRRPARRGRLGAAAAGLLALAAVLLPGAAHAAPPPAFAADRLALAADAVRAADVRGTAWAADPAAGTVRVAADETVTAEDLAGIRRAAGPLAAALDIERVPGRLEPRLQGGEPVYATGGWRCTAGFNARSGGTDFFVTAGHCTDGYPDWYADPGLTVLIGSTAGSTFPGSDYGLVQYTNPDIPRPGTVNCNGRSIDITGATGGTVGGPVHVAAPSGCRSGSITGLNYTVNYGNGVIISGLGRINICAEPGDSGAPVFTGSLAIGVISGGSGNCATGGTTYYQPIGEVLNAYGLVLT
ncbi:S1 family peptidase [Streptomyces sp. MP131-18]|uniref:S1 family peptidase n=1 Tax=Streptomyces sp. MP131-18 TaxID=1857892 RepID=UPI00097C25E5|nr:S1 family peptidase [Streptomyces sp. MP131-18]